MKAYNEPSVEPFDIGFGPTWPDAEVLQTGKTSPERYSSPEQWEIEKAIFGKVWLYAGRIEEIARPGDWIVRDVEIRGASVIIINDRRKGIQAFHNICPHRGMRLLWEESGHDNLLVCPYHAWSFATDGALKVVTDEGSFPGLCKDEKNLVPVHVDVWEGFLFFNLDPAPALSLRDYLGPIADMMKGAPFEEFTCSATASEIMNANWKLGTEAGSEGYHVPALHPKSASPWALPSYNRYGHYIGWEPIGPHRIASIPGNPEFQLDPKKPIQSFSFSHMPQMVVAGTGEAAGLAGKGFGSHPDLNRSKAPDWGADQYGFFPIGAVSASYNGWWQNLYWPVTIDSARWEAKWYFRSPRSRREKFAMECTLAQTRDILTEDNFSIRGQHEGLKGGVIKEITFGHAEMLLRHMTAVMKGITDTFTRGDEPQRLAAE
jgi:phenylpropionate dioxygenase-like ring-hydroxylating dioxygenase large terminal subunit